MEKEPQYELEPNEQMATRVVDLEMQLRKALRQRDQYKDKIGEYTVALRSAVMDLWGEIQLDPPKPQTLRPRSRGLGETAIIGLADWQLGKKTVSYDSEVCEDRIGRFAETTLKLAHERSKERKITDAHIFLLGDLVEGEGIFPGQAHQIDSSLYRQVGVNGPRILGNFLGEMSNHFKNIKVTGVIGNHGALKMQREVNPETNMDRLLYQIVAGQYRNSKNYEFDIPDGDGERNFYAVDRIYDWGFLLAHGDQIRGGFAGFPFYGTAKKAWGWIDSIDQPWDYLYFGHWHTPTRLTLNNRIAYCMGSPESNNSYAQEQLAAVGHPTQYIGFVHPEHGVVSDHWISLENRESQVAKYRRLGGVTLGDVA